jgi:NAD(P)-dependent dehydrogenase (short-subunit alcohol dehydrogenase family)
MSVVDRFRLDGRLAVVTGAGRGLGAATSSALAEAGARVILVGRTEAPLRQVADRLVSGGHAAEVHVADVAEEAEVTELFERLESAHGPVDVLINNAAVVDDRPFTEVATADWDIVMGINVRGVFLASRAMARQDHPGTRSIVNVSSLAASAGVRNEAAYSASKGAVESLTRALAVELARRSIRVNAVAPGYFRTDMPAEILRDERARDALLRRVPMRLVPEPDEIGPTMVYLASEASAFMTGSIIHLDGGYTAI